MGYAFSVPFILSWTKAISHGIAGGRGVVAVVFVYSIKTRRRFQYISSIGKIYVITLYLEDIYGRYCIQKSINDHFHHILT